MEIPFESNDSNQPSMSHSGDFPVLQIGSEFYSGRKKIFQKLVKKKKKKKKKNFLDFFL